jgi:autophagy-related protein 9
MLPQWLGNSLSGSQRPPQGGYAPGYSQGYAQQQQHQYESGGVASSFDFDAYRAGVSGMADQYFNGGQGQWGEGGQYPPPRIDDLDAFFSSMYTYYQNRGLPAILLTQLCSTATLGFTIAFSVFLLACVDWRELRNCHDEASCLDFHAYVRTPFGQASFYNFITFCYMALFFVYWLFQVLSAARTSLEGVRMESFYRRVLGVSLADLQNMQWSDVMRRLITLHDSGVYRVSIQEKLTEYDIVARIMRKDNYMVALINKGVLDIRLPRWVVQYLFMWENSDKTMFLTKSLEWSINFCVLQFMFNENAVMTEEFLRDVKGLQYRFVRVGVMQLLLMPFMLVFMIIHFFLENAQQFRSSQSYLGPRQFSPLAMWMFREYNELPHIFEARINKSYEEGNKYVGLFTNGYAATLAKFVTYISGSFVAILVLVSVIDEAVLLYVRLSDHNLLWYLGIFSGIFAAAASFIPSQSQSPIGGGRGSGYTRNKTTAHGSSSGIGGAFPGAGSGVETTPAEQCMEVIAAHTHYFPSYWMHQCHTLNVRDEFLEIFPYKTKLFAMEVLSVFLTPLVLCFSLPNCVPEMLAFMSRHTKYLDGVGDVCDYSTFDFDAYGNSEFLSPVEGDPSSSDRNDVYADRRAGGDSYLGSGADRQMANNMVGLKDRNSDGKLEQSYMSFRLANPEWEGAVGGFTSANPPPLPASSNGWGGGPRTTTAGARPLVAGMRAAGKGISISTPVRNNNSNKAPADSSSLPFSPPSNPPSASQLESQAGSGSVANHAAGTAGDAMLSRIRHYRHHMTGGNENPIDQLARSISGMKKTQSIAGLFSGAGSIDGSSSAAAGAAAGAAAADKRMPPLHPHSGSANAPRSGEGPRHAPTVASKPDGLRQENLPDGPPTLTGMRNQVSRESVVSSVLDPSSASSHADGDTDMSDVEDHATHDHEQEEQDQEQEQGQAVSGNSASGEAGPEYSLTPEEREEQERLFGRPDGGNQSITSQSGGYTDVIDRSGVDMFVDRGGRPATALSLDDDAHNSITSMLRSALKGDDSETYENDFYWLNKYRSERVRQSVANSSGSMGSYRSNGHGSTAGSFAGSFANDATAYSQYGSPRGSLAAAQHGRQAQAQGHGGYYADHSGQHSGQHRPTQQQQQQVPMQQQSPAAYYSSAFYHESPANEGDNCAAPQPGEATSRGGSRGGQGNTTTNNNKPPVSSDEMASV